MHNMKKLPNNILSLLCASIQINCYKRAIEELVYNALDAESSSIAIRVDIQEGTIQVIDNGLSVRKCDFPLLGERYATSKCVDLSTLKSAPNKYGYRGQSLASIIDISQSVIFTSRCDNGEETWVKSFQKSHEPVVSKTAQRPSRGTTVEIKGFLYNLNIQKRAIDALTEINDIKTFLEQLSLVHSNISLSLRDDSKNEIVFKLHKNRDIYQTLASVFNVNKTDTQELKVEKNNYKATAVIGKKDLEVNQHHWIYLNGKILHNTRLHKTVNDNLSKCLHLKYQTRGKCKSKNEYVDENASKNKIPFYFIFITCPYYDYDVNYMLKQTAVEFRNWVQIDRLLEKLVKFYVGDISLKEITKSTEAQENREHVDSTRNQIKKIIEKILGSNSRKPGVSQMQNGIKGKPIKRKAKKKSNISNPKENKTNEVPADRDTAIVKEMPKKKKIMDISLSKVIPPKNNHSMSHQQVKMPKEVSIAENNPPQDLDCNIIECDDPTSKNNKNKNTENGGNTITTKAQIHNLEKRARHENNSKNTSHNKSISKKIKQCKKINIIRSKINENQKIDNPVCSEKRLKSKDKKKTKHTIDPLRPFERNNDSIKLRRKILAREVDELISYNNKWKRKVFDTEIVQYSSAIIENKIDTFDVDDEVVIHDYAPHKITSSSVDNRVWGGLEKTTYKSYDLIQTILKTQQNFDDEQGNDKNEDYEASQVFTPQYGFNLRPNVGPEIDENSLSLHKLTEEVAIETISTEVTTQQFEINPTPNIIEPQNTDGWVPQPKLTFESHNYENVIVRDFSSPRPQRPNISGHNQRGQNWHFITRNSRDNFIVPDDMRNCKQRMKTGRKKQFNSKPPYEKIAAYNIHNRTRKYLESSYSIEFSKSKEYSSGTTCHENPFHRRILLDVNSNQDQVRTYTIEKEEEYVVHTSKVDSTYTVFSNSLFKFDNTYVNHAASNRNTGCNEPHRTYCVQDSNSIASYYNELQNDVGRTSNDVDIQDRNYAKIIFISKSQEEKRSDDNITSRTDDVIDAINLCETELNSHELTEKEVGSSEPRQVELLLNEEFCEDSLLCDRNVYTQQNIHRQEIVEEISHHFDNTTSIYQQQIEDLTAITNKTIAEDIAIPNAVQGKPNIDNFSKSKQNIRKDLESAEKQTKDTEFNNFNLRSRLSFVPKGLSPIFQNCQTKNVCDYNLENDYYDDMIYNNFANNVQTNTEIFEPKIQNLKELTTRDIEKVNNKLNKDSACLIFDGDSLKQAMVMGQVDEKFIAVKIKDKACHSVGGMTEHLVLFDQHAVHERIRLENNLADYLKGDQWKSIALDDISLKLTKEEILYLHNYKDKFAQFGLQWTVSDDCEAAINAIPEALLGKNPRQVEVVMTAVKNLISEEIQSIKSQKGCVSLYPKSIMDLVFSEACRYAIKFGDKLSHNDCVELLRLLSECKTPFQCAHGRPVMAVLMDIKSQKREYKVNASKIQQFITGLK